jgi:hypothetical protein
VVRDDILRDGECHEHDQLGPSGCPDDLACRTRPGLSPRIGSAPIAAPKVPSFGRLAGAALRRLGRYRMQSGSCPAITNRSFLTLLGHWAPAIAVPHNGPLEPGVIVSECQNCGGGFNRSTQHSSLLIWHVETVCIWRGMHGHGPRGSRRPSSMSAGRAANGWRAPPERSRNERASKILALNGEIAPARSVASTG